MGEKMIEFLQRQSDIDADNILAEVNADPEMADVHAPDEMEAALFARIDEYDMKKAHSNLSEEDRELIELGKAYKKSKKRRKYAAVASIALAGVLLSSVTAMGGPEKVVEKVNWILAGKEQTNIDVDNDRIEKPDEVTEEEVFAQIEKEFGFIPVKMFYIPEGIVFREKTINKETQYINMVYQGDNNRVIICVICPNYKVSSIGSDMEDILTNQYSKEVAGREIIIKHYIVKENKEERWIVEFEDENIFYFYQMYNLEKEEVNKITDKLFFNY